MASKKTPVMETPETEEQELEETVKKDDGLEAEAKVKAQQAEIEKLKKQLAEAQKAKPAARNRDDAEAVRQAGRDAIAAGVDPWTVTVSVRSPRRSGKEDPWYWICVNGQGVQIPADDKYHDVKLPWAEVLVDMLAAERNAEEFQDSIEVYDPVTNPHKE